MSSCCGTNNSECNCSEDRSGKMCMLTTPPFKFDLEKIKHLVNNPKYICKCCGRVSNTKELLCAPEEIGGKQ